MGEYIDLAHVEPLHLKNNSWQHYFKGVLKEAISKSKLPDTCKTFADVPIGGFHCHTIIKTIQQIKSRIKKIKEDEYSNSLTKIQVCAMFRAGDIRRNVLLKFIRLCMETPCLCPSEGHKYGGRKLTKTYVMEFCYKKLIVVF